MRCSLECLVKVVYMILRDVKLIMSFHHITKGFFDTPKTCLGSVKSWIHSLEETFKKEFNRNVIMKSYCVQCFTKLIHDFLYDEFYYVFADQLS